MPDRHRQGQAEPLYHPIFVIVSLFVLVAAGVLLVVFGVLADTEDDESWKSVWGGLSVLSGVIAGSSLVVLTIEYFAISHLVTPVREDTKSLEEESRRLFTKVVQLIDLVRGERESGLINHYTDRRQAVAEIYRAVKSARKRVLFLGICNDIFEELRIALPDEVDCQEQFRNALLRVMKEAKEECAVEFLYLDREAKDLYLPRQEAESGQKPGSLSECELLRHARVSLNQHTLRLYFEAVEEGVQNRLHIKEYHLAPTLSTIVIDDRLFVAPYIAESCTNVAVQEYSLKERTSDSRIPPDSLKYFNNYDTYASIYYSKLITLPEPLSDEERARLLDWRASGSQLQFWEPDRPGPYEELVAELARQRMTDSVAQP